MATIGAANDPQSYVIEIPDETSSAVPFSGLFLGLANSVLAALVRLKNQVQSTSHLSDKFSAVSTDWTVNSQILHVYGEIHGYLLIDLVAKKSFTVPADGNMGNLIVGNIATGYEANAQATLSSGSNGRSANGYTLADGTVKLASVGGTGDIATGDHITLGGYMPLNAAVRSGI